MRAMNVRDLMKSPVHFCSPTHTLNEAARIFWEHDCGVLPVLNEKRQVVGMLTDRDVCIAAYTQGCTLRDLPVQLAMARAVTRCSPGHEIEAALQIMATAQVHRLPVVDSGERLVGLLSLTDIQRAAQSLPSPSRQRLALLLLDAQAMIGAPRGKARTQPKAPRKSIKRSTTSRSSAQRGNASSK